MIDAITNLTPQPVAVEGQSDAGQQAGSAGSSFTDVLSAAVAEGQGTQAKTAPQSEPKAKSDGEPAKNDDLAGTIQVAMAMPVQANVAVAVEAAPADNTVLAAVSEDSAQPVQSVGPQTPQMGQVQTMPTPAATSDAPQNSAAVVEQPITAAQSATDLANAMAQSQTVQTEAVPSTVQTETTTAQPTMTEQPAVAKAGAQAIASPKQDSTSAQVNAQSQPKATAEQQATPIDRSDDQAAKSDRPVAAETQQTRPSNAQESRIPVDTVPVQWRFEGNGQAQQASGSQAQAIVQGIGESNTKPAGGDTGSATGQGSTDPQAAASTGLQFNAQLRSVGTEAGATTPSPDLHVRVIDQVVQGVKLSQIDGRSNIVVKLNPPDLGNLRLQITQDATGMTTHIQAANSQVRGLLEANMPLLIDSLSKAGVQMDSVSVSVGTSFNAFAQNANQGNPQTNQGQNRQQYAAVPMMGGVQTMADASYPMRGRSEQAGYSWLA